MKTNHQNVERIILQKLLDAAQLKEIFNDERWQKYVNTQLLTLGIDAATQRKLAREGFSEISALDLNEQLSVFTHLFKYSQVFEIKNQCLIFLDQHKKKKLSVAHWPILKEWVKYVDNWAHSDGLSSVFSMMLQQDLDLLLPQLKVWNASKNPWERRQSVVCLFYYSRTRKNFFAFEDAMELIQNLLDDKEYYVQKGIGWALREASNVYYELTLDFILQHVTKIKPAAYSAATEKLLPHHKEQVKLLRKKKSTF